MKGNKGITLIALVITIIVLLILAGVSIAMLSGDNSILTRSRQAGYATAITSAKEQVAVAVNAAMADYYNDVYVAGTTSAGDIRAYVEAKLTGTNGALTVTYDQVTIDATGLSGDSRTHKFTIKYNGDNSKMTTGEFVDTNAKLTWTDAYSS